MRRARARQRRRDRGSGFGLITITHSYKTHAPEVTKRIKDIQEAFGVGLVKSKEFPIFKNFKVRIRPGDIVYITGRSGSGKSTLLRLLAEHFGRDKVATLDDVKIDPDKAIVDQIGRDTQEAIKLLSMVGLAEPWVWARRYSELSEGQKYRFRLAKLLESHKPILIVDEFASTLDADTAKVVAYNFARAARRMGKTVILATTREDLKDDLRPNIYIHKDIEPGEVEVEYDEHPDTSQGCSIAELVRVEPGTKADWEKLKEFHYRSHKLPPPKAIFRAVYNGKTIGVIVYSSCFPATKGRVQAVGYKPSIEELNREWARISRVVIHPAYRGIGLGAKLVRESLKLAAKMGIRHVETTAAMARYNPFFEKAGMKKIMTVEPDESVKRACERLRALGLEPALLADREYVLDRLKHMSKAELDKVREALAEVKPVYGRALLGSGRAYMRKEEYMRALSQLGLEELAKVLSKLAELASPKIYLYWCAKWLKEERAKEKPTMADIRARMRQRPIRAVLADLQAKAPIAPSVEEWLKRPQVWDLPGVDTPGTPHKLMVEIGGREVEIKERGNR